MKPVERRLRLDSFDDLVLNDDVEVQMRMASPRFIVRLARDGSDRFGERGRAEVFHLPKALDLGVMEIILEREAPPADARRLLTYSGTLEAAQGYAQGMLDAVRLMLDRRAEADEEQAPLPPKPAAKNDDILRCPLCAAPMKYVEKSVKGPFYGCPRSCRTWTSRRELVA
jgi:hypothetical protein